jgi:hypothetical protein
MRLARVSHAPHAPHFTFDRIQFFDPDTQAMADPSHDENRGAEVLDLEIHGAPQGQL